MRRRTATPAAVLSLLVLAAPASAVVLGPGEAGAAVRPATAVAPVPVALVRGAAAPGALAVAEPAPGDPAAGAALGRRVDAALAGSGATTVAAAVDVAGFDAVLRRDAAHALPPASTQKSFTGLSALVALGPDARFRTTVVRTATPVAGRLPGSVWLVAGGDPYLTSSGLRTLARDVRAAGISTIAGDVRLDDSRYDQKRRAEGWKASWVPDGFGPLSAMALDRNTWREDSAFLADPALPAAVRFRDLLRAEGVTVTGTVRRERTPAGAQPVAERVSGTVPAVVRRALKDSDNFAAELLLKEVGRTVKGDGSSLGGIAAVKQVLGGLGVPVGAGADGSGLSSRDRQTPAGQVRLLRAADASVAGPSFRAALPIACQDGTLKRRFCSTPAAGKVFAKTGTLSGVRALAGFTRTASGRDVWFAFQLTGVSDGTRALKAVDRAVVVLATAQE